MADITDTKVAFLLGNGVEQAEFTEPWDAVKKAGGTPVLVSPESGSITAMKGDWDHADSFDVDVEVKDAKADDYDALVVPGGTVNADSLRIDSDAQEFVKAFFAADKPVASICHGPWILIDAGLAKGRRMTSYVSISTDLKNAGVTWTDEECVVDGNLITSRAPGDLEVFCSTLVEKIAAAKK
ncbi:type 1 glutamine amidotransferase domain-containing protein [Mobilicoccus pelagius]|uniref:Peptidase C56 family protein n=1 Tax=Mobilicoccus pelagius NBRC 104925 TaxID=1089455 RepID=H5UR36_9MICO|nr:type 1 glutamine amidotransferase domain-containing protein [Mobilicoccus pelagius]GAB48194.1 peptidase C56 family protein [Mobilicoccus pelagius NBRC 104925]